MVSEKGELRKNTHHGKPPGGGSTEEGFES